MRSDKVDLSYSSTVCWLKTGQVTLFNLRFLTYKMGTSKGLYLKLTDIKVWFVRTRTLSLV